MRFTEKMILLKNGKRAVLRCPRAADAAAMTAFLMRVSSETDFLLSYPEERAIAEDTQIRILETSWRSSNELMIACFVEGKLAAVSQIACLPNRKTAHRAVLSVVVSEEFWGQGIGTALMAEMESRARMKGIKQLELSFAEGNDRAMALYEKMGFASCAKMPNAYRLSDGRSLCEIFMIKEL